MKLNVQRRLAAQVMDCSPKRIRFDTEKLPEIKEAITKFDINGLINQGLITVIPARGISRFWAKKRHLQRSKGKRRGQGKRKGSFNSRMPSKRAWINRIRLQRSLLKSLKEKEMISQETYSTLYKKAKGGFFRSKKHLQIYLEERKLVQKGKK
jgi:large subunit ribosomal protein L19e